MRKNIRISERISGIAIMALGVGLVAIDYFIVKAMMSVGLWGAPALSAPEIGVALTILLCIPLLGVLCIFALAGGFVFLRGLSWVTGGVI